MGVAAAALLTAVGCGDDGSAADDADGTTAPPTTLADSTTTTLSVEAEIEARYREWARIITEVSKAPDPDDPRLARVMIEPRLSIVRAAMAGLAARNQVYEPSPASTQTVLSVTDRGDGSAALVVCRVAQDRLIDKDLGHTIPAGTSTAKDQVSLRLVGGVWMVEDYVNVETWEGVSPCGD